ncbi:MAG: hypothetical protein AAF449_00695, partial [Myxococcota bacterium]
LIQDCKILEWNELESVITAMPTFFQASQQAGIEGRMIFDPKATNNYLTKEVAKLGWQSIPVPPNLTEFGTDWDGGKQSVLAEWQFSNYPFLWNNVIRTEAVYNARMQLPHVGEVSALVVVTKCGLFPSSNSTLYYEQARAQLETVTDLGAFSIPIRLVGLSVPLGIEDIEAVWSTYPGRYARHPDEQRVVRCRVIWGREMKYGTRSARFSLR